MIRDYTSRISIYSKLTYLTHLTYLFNTFYLIFSFIYHISLIIYHEKFLFTFNNKLLRSSNQYITVFVLYENLYKKDKLAIKKLIKY